MRGTSRAAAIVIATVLTSGTPIAAAERASDLPVRTANPSLATAVRDGMRVSATFRRLAEEIGVLKGIVYLHPGRCHGIMRSCMLLDVAHAGSYRLLFVMVDTAQNSVDLTGGVGHELQHAVEILGANVHTKSAALAFYLRYGKRISGHFETEAATRIAEVIRTELRDARPRPDHLTDLAQNTAAALTR